MKMLKQLGFSLPEVLLAAGLASGLALVVAKISQNASQVTKTTETNNEINMFMSEVAYALSNKANCNATIPAGSASSGFNPTAIRRVMPDGTIKDIYNAGPDHSYGNGTFRIVSMETEMTSADTVNLIINIERLSKVALGAKEIKKRIPLKVVQDATNTQIVSCFSDTDDIIETAAKAACHGPTARWDDTTKQCFHDVDTTECPPGQMVRSLNTGPDNEIIKECIPIIADPQTCPAGSFLSGIDSTGKANCTQAISTSACSNGQYAWITGGVVTCRDIPACSGGVLSTLSDGSLHCKPLKCSNSNEYLVGVNADGTLDCRQIPHNSCGAGKYIRSVSPTGVIECDNIPPAALGVAPANEYLKGYDNSTGSRVTGFIPTCTGANYLQFNGTQFQCVPITTATACTPNCPNPKEVCTGKTFYADDGCGGSCNVVGTAKCNVICGFVARGATSCTNLNWTEKNFGNIGWEACRARCEFWMNRGNRSGGCWIKASGGTCYCRGGDLGLASNESFNSSDGGACSQVRKQ